MRTARYSMTLILLAVQFTHAAICEKVAKSSSAELMELLKGDLQSTTPECIEQAVVRLGDFREASAAAVLVNFLDFKRPLNEREKLGINMRWERFPAVGALFSIGKPAIPALLATLRSEKITEVARQNAIRAVSTIFRDDPPQGVGELRKAAREAKEPTEAARLRSGAESAAALCSDSWRDRCKGELTDAEKK